MPIAVWPRPQLVLLRTDTGHVREDNVDVDFQFISSRRVDIQLRMNLRGANRHSGGQSLVSDSTNSLFEKNNTDN